MWKYNKQLITWKNVQSAAMFATSQCLGMHKEKLQKNSQKTKGESFRFKTKTKNVEQAKLKKIYQKREGGRGGGDGCVQGRDKKLGLLK